ncbi:MAG: 1-acyl-sn-glycerol-3-phosphate acyltransferase [Caulobacteraceae bacterium]|nr:1-acyl-sn-glycerol-3-phosphate acyltransferase [Caulobacteraceae bacterium]
MSEKSAIDAPINQTTSRPAHAHDMFADITRFVCATYLQLSGWKVRGNFPALDKAVLVAAPHTSNWDGINMLATAGYYRVKLKWMGKKSLTTGPFGGLIKWLGCVPIDRSAANDVVRVMADAFAATPRMILAIPPEGTRSAARMENRLLSHRPRRQRAANPQRVGLRHKDHQPRCHHHAQRRLRPRSRDHPKLLRQRARQTRGQVRAQALTFARSTAQQIASTIVS